ncbi:MAG: Ig-like domain-containing protein [Lysobacterales bacterium]
MARFFIHCLLSVTLLVLPGLSHSSTILNDADKDPTVTLSPDALTATFGLGVHRGVRSVDSVAPNSGFFYYEGRRNGVSGNYGFGVATSSELITTADLSGQSPSEGYGGRSDQSLGVNTAGFIFYNNSQQIPSPDPSITSADTFGLALDYSGSTPEVHVIVDDQLLYSQAMPNVTDPLHVLVYGRQVSQTSQTINSAADLQNTPMRYDARTILLNAGITSAANLIRGWTPRTTLSINTPAQSVDTGQTLVLNAFAHDETGMDISAQIQWSDNASANTGTGATFSVTSATTGPHVITAQVLDAMSNPITFDVLITFVVPDSDDDGLTDDEEMVLMTSPTDADTDNDGLSDGYEVNESLTDPLLSDSDGDLVPDQYELTYGSDPLVANASDDADTDGFNLLDEFNAGTSASFAGSFPGSGPETVFESSDVHSSVLIGSTRRALTFEDSLVRSARASETVMSGTGWYYFEAERNSQRGNFGIGVGSAAAALTEAPGADRQSLALTINGEVLYDGLTVQSAQPLESSRHLGLAVDYSGSSPVVYPIISGADGFAQMLDAVALPDITGDLFLMAFGDNLFGAQQLQINAGDDPDNHPFQFPAGYLLFTDGVPGAEFMGSGWALANAYNGRVQPPQQTEVLLQLDDNSGAGITLGPQNLSVAYDIDQKMGVRANQGMIDEFRYFEASRLLATIIIGSDEGFGIGQGLITEFGRINPYPFDPEQPSMSTNSINGIWQNLNQVGNYDTSTFHYGFAVDYREARPTVYLIIEDQVVYTMLLPDVFTPLFPFLYGNTQGMGVFATEINFGASPFQYSPRTAMENANIPFNGFVSGWGDVNSDLDADNLRDSDEVANSGDTLNPDTDGDGLNDGDEFHVHGTSVSSRDTDTDGVPDGYELAVGTDPLIDDAAGDINTNGSSNLDDYLNGTGLPEAPPVVTIFEDDMTIEVDDTLMLRASVSDVIDPSLLGTISWSDSISSATATGRDFSAMLLPGVHVITAQATDSEGNIGMDQVTITVINTNDPPVGLDDQFNLTEDAQVALDVLDNDTDIDGHSLTISAIQVPAELENNITNDGNQLQFDPAGDYDFLDQGEVLSPSLVFTYDITDSQPDEGTDTDITVTINLTGINDAPRGTIPTLDVIQDLVFNVSLSDFITDPELHAITYALVSGPASGQAMISNDGELSYTPVIGFTGQVDLTFSAFDGTATAQFVVNLDVQPRPTTDDGPIAAVEDTIMNTGDVLSNDFLAMGPSSLAGFDAASAQGGVVDSQGDGTFNYTPPQDYFGPDSFVYRIAANSRLYEATVTIEVAAANDRPTFDVLGDQSHSAGQSGTIVLENFISQVLTGPANEQSTQSIVGAGATVTSDPGSIIDAASLDPSGQFSYDLNGRAGTAVIELTISDDGGSANNGQPVSLPVPVSITVSNALDVGVSIVSLQQQVDPGGELEFLVTVSNLGTTDAMTISATSNLSDAAFFARTTWECGPVQNAVCVPPPAGELTATLDLPVGSSISLIQTVTIVEDTELDTVTNTMTLRTTPIQIDVNATNDSSSTTVGVVQVMFESGFETPSAGLR